MLEENNVLKYVLYITPKLFYKLQQMKEVCLKDTFPITLSLDGAQVFQPSMRGRSLGETVGQEEDTFIVATSNELSSASVASLPP